METQADTAAGAAAQARGDAQTTVKVAIVGGGCAGLAAAWQLCQQPGYEIHVYEKTWRLGGKAASVRDAEGHILDHGLHIWLGFYENAFRMMRECYDEVALQHWGPHAPDPRDRLMYHSIDDAFFPEPHIGVAGEDPTGTWTMWSGFLPPAKGLPGEPLDEESNPYTLRSYLLRCLDLLRALMVSVIAAPSEDRPGRPRPDARSRSDEALNLDFSFDAARSPKVFIDSVARLVRSTVLTTAAGLLQAVTILETYLKQLNFAPQVADSVLELMQAVAGQLRKQLRDVVAVDPKLRWKTEIIDIVMTIAVGLYRDRVLFERKGFDAINHIDYRQWLLHHGATNTSVESRFMTGIYDLVFAYRNGDRSQPALAAGVALRGALRMFFTYRGSMFWRMRSGMGETVFAPLYRALREDTWQTQEPNKQSRKKSPVTFHFLHELVGVAFDFSDKSRRMVTQLAFSTGADPAALSEYALDEYGCWPSTEAMRFGAAVGAWEEIPERERPLEILEVGTGFHAVVFAMAVDDFKVAVSTGGFFAPHNRMPERWTRMFREVKTVATKAAQVWIDKDLEALGWHRGAGVFTALGLSFDTWADMTHTIPSEAAWRRAPFSTQAPENTTGGEERGTGEVPRDTMYDPDETAADEEAHNSNRAGADGATPESEDAEAAESAAPQEAQNRAANPQHSNLEDMVSRATTTSGRARLPEPQSVAYFCGVLDQALLKDKTDDEARALVEEDLDQMLRHDLAPVWPGAFADQRNALSLVIKEHAQANWKNSDRYTLSLPGSIDDRISPLDASVKNMTIAGDWTACGLDAGCLEAAVMSGMLAAHAISRYPKLENIIGYDHP